MVHVYFIHEEIPSTKKCKMFSMPLSQCPKISFNKISNTIHKTYKGLTIFGSIGSASYQSPSMPYLLGYHAIHFWKS